MKKYFELVSNYEKVDGVISARLSDFSKIRNKEDVFYELCFCLLTPQSNAKKCDDAISILKRKNLYNSNMGLNEIKNILRTRTRFHNNKAKYVKNLREVFEKMWDEFDFVNKSSNSVEIREWIVKNVKGIGLKEASHFLRNVGFRNLAILDRHILRNLGRLGAINEDFKGLTKNKYFIIEKNFINLSKKIGIEMDNLDLYFWYSETGEVFK